MVKTEEQLVEEQLVEEQLVDRWVTRYALTQGIVFCAGTLTDGPDVYFRVDCRLDCNPLGGFFAPKDYHESWDATVERADGMIEARKKSLKKELDKLARHQKGAWNQRKDTNAKIYTL
jgi:hypothetical protein